MDILFRSLGEVPDYCAPVVADNRVQYQFARSFSFIGLKYCNGTPVDPADYVVFIALAEQQGIEFTTISIELAAQLSGPFVINLRKSGADFFSGKFKQINDCEKAVRIRGVGLCRSEIGTNFQSDDLFDALTLSDTSYIYGSWPSLDDPEVLVTFQPRTSIWSEVITNAFEVEANYEGDNNVQTSTRTARGLVAYMSENVPLWHANQLASTLSAFDIELTYYKGTTQVIEFGEVLIEPMKLEIQEGKELFYRGDILFKPVEQMKYRLCEGCGLQGNGTICGAELANLDGVRIDITEDSSGLLFTVNPTLEVLIPNVPYPYDMTLTTYADDRTTVIDTYSTAVNNVSDFITDQNLLPEAAVSGPLYYGVLQIISEVCGTVCLGFTFGLGNSFVETSTNVYNGTCTDALPPPPVGGDCCTEFNDAIIELSLRITDQTVTAGANNDQATFEVFYPTATGCRNTGAQIMSIQDTDGRCLISKDFISTGGGGGYFFGNAPLNGPAGFFLPSTFTTFLPDALSPTIINAAPNTVDCGLCYIYVQFIAISACGGYGTRTRIMKYEVDLGAWSGGASGTTLVCVYVGDVPTLPSCIVV